MARLIPAGWITGVVWCLLINSAAAAAVEDISLTCASELTRQIPVRPTTAPTGSAIVKQVMELSGEARDTVVSAELLAGNIPSFLRHLIPVSFDGKLPDGQDVQVTICVTPDYLAIGTDSDFVRIPMGLPAAAEIADRFGFLLPTTRMVDAIYAQARIHLKPSPMPANNQMRSTDYLWRHNQTVERQCAESGRALAALTAGQKKDLVLSNRLRAAAGRVAIYGWHRKSGAPIQPLSTVHGEGYADYSHGVRLVSATAFVNGVAQPLANLLQDPRLAKIISSEGPIAEPRVLLASLYGH
jgi:hypothetical protein